MIVLLQQQTQFFVSVVFLECDARQNIGCIRIRNSYVYIVDFYTRQAYNTISISLHDCKQINDDILQRENNDEIHFKTDFNL